jgi:hypothetical protein
MAMNFKKFMFQWNKEFHIPAGSERFSVISLQDGLWPLLLLAGIATVSVWWIKVYNLRKWPTLVGTVTAGLGICDMKFERYAMLCSITDKTRLSLSKSGENSLGLSDTRTNCAQLTRGWSTLTWKSYTFPGSGLTKGVYKIQLESQTGHWFSLRWWRNWSLWWHQVIVVTSWYGISPYMKGDRDRSNLCGALGFGTYAHRVFAPFMNGYHLLIPAGPVLDELWFYLCQHRL